MNQIKSLSNLAYKIVRENANRYPVAVARYMSNWVPEDKVTHTGQKWQPDDYRLARFVDKTKHVNPNFAIKLIAEVPPKPCKDRVVYCDGGNGPLGHPKVYINLDGVEADGFRSAVYVCLWGATGFYPGSTVFQHLYWSSCNCVQDSTYVLTLALNGSTNNHRKGSLLYFF